MTHKVNEHLDKRRLRGRGSSREGTHGQPTFPKNPEARFKWQRFIQSSNPRAESERDRKQGRKGWGTSANDVLLQGHCPMMSHSCSVGLSTMLYGMDGWTHCTKQPGCSKDIGDLPSIFIPSLNSPLLKCILEGGNSSPLLDWITQSLQQSSMPWDIHFLWAQKC